MIPVDMAGCPNDDVIAALTEGRLSEREATLLHEHVDGCQSCQWLLREMAASAHTGTSLPSKNSDAPIVIAPGVVLGERYRLERVLGNGGMGTVWAAVHVGTDRRVALKILRRERDTAPSARLRFLREARLLGRIEHPHLVPVRDVFEDRGVPILAMDFLLGESLGARLRRDGKIPLPELARLIVGALAAVDTAHDAGIVHRDLKPDNLFLVPASDQSEATMRVLDFGVAKLMRKEDADGTVLTAAGEVLGTPPYMAPEQLRGETVDRRADVWAFGVILYECLSGRRPFTGDRFAQYFERVTSGARAPFVEAAPDAPREMAALVERMLTVQLSARSPSLQDALSVLRSHALPRAGVARPKARRWGAVLTLLFVASAMVAGWFYWTHGRAAAVTASVATSNAGPEPRSAPESRSAPEPHITPPSPAPASSACERAWGETLATTLCHDPILAMREAAYRTSDELAGQSTPGSRDALASELHACRGAEPCLLKRLQAVGARISVVDCARAVSRDAKAICKSVPLASLEGSLAAFYQVNREHYTQEASRLRRLPSGRYGVAGADKKTITPVPPPAAFSAEQTAWLVTRHRCSDDERCLTRLFEERIVALRAIHQAFVGP